MFKKLLCIVLLISFLHTNIVYSNQKHFLSSSSYFHEERFRQVYRVLASVLSLIRDDRPFDVQELRARFNVDVYRDPTGVYLDIKGWKIRFFEITETFAPPLRIDDELVYEEMINDTLRMQIYFRRLSDDDRETIRTFLARNLDVSNLGKMVLECITGDSVLLDAPTAEDDEPEIDAECEEIMGLYRERAEEEEYREYFVRREKIPADIRVIEGEDLYRFEHRDFENKPDFIGLNKRLFGDGFSDESRLFLLRHCIDRIGSPKYKTIINDAKYLLTVSEEERGKILEELEECELVEFLKDILKDYEKGDKLSPATKRRIRRYTGLEFKTYTSPSPDRAKIWYAVGGNPNAKVTLVFLHGIGENPRDWKNQITVFEHNYKTISIALRGFGKSQGTGTKDPHIRNYSKDVEGILERESIDYAILVGHSMGGMVALNIDEIYKDNPLGVRRIKGIGIIGSRAGNPFESLLFEIMKYVNFKRYVEWFLNHSKWFGRMWDNSIFKQLVKSPKFRSRVDKIATKTILSEEIPLDVRLKIIGFIFKSDFESLKYALLSIMKHDVKDRLVRDLKIPLLSVIGEKDKVILLWAQLADVEGIENCTVLRIDESRHYPQMVDPRRVNQAINELIFLVSVNERINKRFGIEVSLKELEKETNHIRDRLVHKLGGIQGPDLGSIDDISKIVMDCGKDADISHNHKLMIKIVMIVADKILSKIAVPDSPISREEDLKTLYTNILQSV